MPKREENVKPAAGARMSDAAATETLNVTWTL